MSFFRSLFLVIELLIKVVDLARQQSSFDRANKDD